MGLGGYLTWTAVAREIIKRSSEPLKVYPFEAHGSTNKFIKSEIFNNNPYFWNTEEEVKVFPLQLNNPHTNYCLYDTPTRAVHKTGKHIIEQACLHYGIRDPELKCELYFSEEEEKKAKKLRKRLSQQFIVIEPNSKINYTPNRIYSQEKWQKIINTISEEIEIVQMGPPDSRPLKNVTSLIGETTFREAARLIGYAGLLLSTEGGLTHAATAVDTTALVIITGYQDPKMIAYPQNININIGKHGPCGLKIPCTDCKEDDKNHNEMEIVEKALDYLQKNQIRRGTL